MCPVSSAAFTCSQEPKKTQLGARHRLQSVNTQATSKLHTHKAMTTLLHTSGRWIPVHPTSSASSWINPVSFILETEYARLSKVIKQERRGRVWRSVIFFETHSILGRTYLRPAGCSLCGQSICATLTLPGPSRPTGGGYNNPDEKNTRQIQKGEKGTLEALLLWPL